MVLLVKIIDETKNKYEKGGRVKMMRLMINHWKSKSNVIPNCNVADNNNHNIKK